MKSHIRTLYATLFLPGILLFFAAGCGDKAKALKRADDRATVDSLVGLQLQDIAQKSDENLSYRMTIEVKQKADSIVAARTAPPAPAHAKP